MIFVLRLLSLTSGPTRVSPTTQIKGTVAQGRSLQEEFCQQVPRTPDPPFVSLELEQAQENSCVALCSLPHRASMGGRGREATSALGDVHGAAAGTCPPAKRKVTLRRRERKEIIRLRLLRAGGLPRSVLSCDFARLCVEFAQLMCDFFF